MSDHCLNSNKTMWLVMIMTLLWECLPSGHPPRLINNKQAKYYKLQVVSNYYIFHVGKESNKPPLQFDHSSFRALVANFYVIESKCLCLQRAHSCKKLLYVEKMKSSLPQKRKTRSNTDSIKSAKLILEPEDSWNHP